MRFQYQYKLSGGERRAGVCEASSKDAVFAILKKNGIKPFDVKLAPGFFNRLQSFGKRGLAIAVLSLGCVALAIAIVVLDTSQSSSVGTFLDDAVRRQIIGDPAVIDQGVRTGWADIFALEGDRFLASFAIPGVPPAVRSTSEEKIREALSSEQSRQKGSSCAQSSLEARQVFAIVAGMKDELRQFLADGGSIVQYGRLLVQRQEQEIDYYNRAKNEIEIASQTGDGANLNALWTKRNLELKRMGIKTVFLPDPKNEIPR